MAQAVSATAPALDRALAAPERPSLAAGEATATLVIENMNCGSCLSKVERALTAAPGVLTARANLSAKRADVTYRAGKVSVSDLVDALGRAGFKAAEVTDVGSERDPDVGRDYLRRIAVAGFATANIMLLSVAVWSGASGDMPSSLQAMFHWLSAIIAIPAVAYAGQPFFRSAYAALKSGRVNMDVPISLGVTLATGMSVFQTARGSEQVYFDAAVMLLLFLLVGRALDERMRARAQSAAADLLRLRAPTATLIDTNGATRHIRSADLSTGMSILTATGERFAADGLIVAGEGEIDDSLITGETRPRRVAPGDKVYAGTVNLGQAMTIEATVAGEGTLVAEIGRMMAAAEQGRASYVRLADRAARLYAPAVHTLGLMTFLGWLAAGHGWVQALTAAIAVLIITCPCALALAVPAVQVAATSRLFRKGVLLKAPDALERLADVDTIVLDKTGTLTIGEPTLDATADIDDTALLRASRLAIASRHPYARAVVKAAMARGLNITVASSVAETPGSGLSRMMPGGEERLGSARWCGVIDDAGAALWYRAPDLAPVRFDLADRLRPDAKAFIAHVKTVGFSVELLSGDRRAEVEKIAGEVGIERFSGELLPGQKLARIEELAAQGHRVLMIGDGLNDAPALAAGHASLSPSTAMDISQTASDAIIQGQALGPVIEVLGIAREVRRMSLQNFAIAIGYNLVFVPLAVVGLVTPLIAALAMSASSIAVTANALRLKSKRLNLAVRRAGS